MHLDGADIRLTWSFYSVPHLAVNLAALLPRWAPLSDGHYALLHSGYSCMFVVFMAT
jgi:hypothetical protein